MTITTDKNKQMDIYRDLKGQEIKKKKIKLEIFLKWKFFKSWATSIIFSL